jgi:hypothetical protein
MISAGVLQGRRDVRQRKDGVVRFLHGSSEGFAARGAMGACMKDILGAVRCTALQS